ncbi:MAG: ATP-binding cassette domain-containing protein [Caldilineaceae bacterium]
MPVLEAQNLTKTYHIEDRAITVLDDVSFAIDPGEFVVIKGSSGSGKSTLLSLLSGLDSPTAGRVFVDGNDITDLSEDQLAPLRNETIGFVFQSFHLVPSLQALENIMFPAELKGDRHAETAPWRVERCGAAWPRANYPHQLSGGRKAARGHLPRPDQRSADPLCRRTHRQPRLEERRRHPRSAARPARTRMTLVMVTHSEKKSRRWPGRC